MSTETYAPIVKVSDKRGLALLEETIEEIEEHEHATWNQAVWLDSDSLWVEDMPEVVAEKRVPAFDCGTTACLFGHVVFKAGARMYEYLEGGPRFSDWEVEVAGQLRSIENYARELLGLTWDQSEWLSNAERTWDEIVEFRDAWQRDAAVGSDVDEAREAVIHPDDEDGASW